MPVVVCLWMALGLAGCEDRSPLGDRSPEAPPPPALLEGVILKTDVGATHLVARAESVALAPDTPARAREVEAEVETTDRTLRIDADRADWDLEAHTVRFEGKVTAERRPVLLECDVLEVTYEDPEHLERAVARGNVRVTRGPRRARAAEATLHVPSGRLELTGDPVVEEGANLLTGERIILFLDEERLECESCHLVVSEDSPPGDRPREGGSAPEPNPGAGP